MSSRYFITDSTGIFINWYSRLLGLETDGQELVLSGNSGADSVYVGERTQVDATVLLGGDDNIYLTGNFADYTQSIEGNQYTFSRDIDGFTESVTFVSNFGENDRLYFADGSVNIGFDNLFDSGAFRPIVGTELDSQVTPAFPLDSIPAQSTGSATRVFVTDPTGEVIAAGIKGSVFQVSGNSGIDKVVVGEGTQVDATVLLGGRDEIYLSGNFADYTQSVNGNEYTFSRTIDGNTESVKFVVNFSQSDVIYFADGNAEIDFSTLFSGSEFRLITQGDISGEGTPTDGPADTIITSASASAVSGTAERDSTVTLLDADGNAIVDGSSNPLTATVDASGNWTIDITVASPALAAGAVVKAIARDGDGADIDTSDPYSVDVVPPVDPTVNVASGTVISGAAEMGSTVEVDTDGDGNPDYTTTANENGEWSVALDPALTDGATVDVTATDSSGNTSGVTTATVDAVAPDAPVVAATGDTAIGTAEAGATLILTDADNNEYTTTVAEDGTWSISGLTLTDATTVSATATDANGNVSNPGTATVDASAPDAPVITSSSATEVSGTAEANSTITLTDTAGDEYEVTASGTGAWTVTGLTLTTGSIQVTASDAADNVSDATTALVDFEAPEITLAEVSANLISGTAEADASIAIDTDNDGTADYTTTADASGNWSVIPSPALTSNTAVSVTATDAANNTSAPVMATTGPSVTVNAYPNTVDGDRDYVNANFFDVGDTITVTVDYGETITGSGVSGSLTVGGIAFTNVAVSGTTLVFTYTVTASDSIAASAFTTDLSTDLTVTGATIGGSAVPTNFAGSIALDRIVEGAAPTISYTDTGAADGITDDVTISVTNLAANSSTWEYSVNGGANWTTGAAADASGNASFDVTAPVDGTILVRDGGVTSNPLDYVRIVDSLIAITSVTDNVPNTVGALADGDSTDDRQPTVSGTLAAPLVAGDTVTVLIGGSSIGTAIIGADGLSWSLDVSSDIALGDNEITAQINYAAGGSATSASHTISVIGAPTATVAITSADDDVGAVTGSIAAPGGVTDDTLPILQGSITGTLGAGEVIAIYDNGVRLGEANDNGDNTWSYDYTQPVEASFTATNGRVSANGNDLYAHNARNRWNQAALHADENFALDGMVSFTTAEANTNKVAGLNTQGDLTGLHFNQIDFAFQLQADGTFLVRENGAIVEDTDRTYTAGDVFAIERSGTTVTYTYNGTVVHTSSQTSTGDLYFDSAFYTRYGTINDIVIDSTTPLGHGEHTLTAVVENPSAGLSGAESADYTLFLNSISITTISDDAGAMTGPIATGEVTDDTTPIISGTITAPLSGTQVIRIYDNTSSTFLTGTVTVNADNTWTYALDTLPEAGYDLVAGIYPDGTSTTADFTSAAFAVTVDVPPSPDAVASITAIADDVGNITGSITASGNSTDDGLPVLSGIIATSGTYNAGEVVAIYDGSIRLGEATLDTGAGTWSFTITNALVAGNHTFTAVVENTSTGEAATASAVFALNINNIAIVALSDDAGSVIGVVADMGATDDTTPTLSGTLGAALIGSEEIVVYYDNGGTETEFVGTVTVNADNTWSFVPDSALAVDTYAFTAKI